MDIPDIRQQLVERERFAPDVVEIRAAILAAQAGPREVRTGPHRTNVLVGAVAATVILIVVAIGLVRFLAPTLQVASQGAPAPAAPSWIGINWHLVEVALGGTHTKVGNTGGIDLQFAPNRSVTGSAICYGLIGHWTLVQTLEVGQTLELGPLNRLEHSCPFDPRRTEPAVVEQGLESLTTVGATGGYDDRKNLTLYSGPYELTFHHVGPVVVYPLSADPTYPREAVPSSAAHQPSTGSSNPPATH